MESKQEVENLNWDNEMLDEKHKNLKQKSKYLKENLNDLKVKWEELEDVVNYHIKTINCQKTEREDLIGGKRN